MSLLRIWAGLTIIAFTAGCSDRPDRQSDMTTTQAAAYATNEPGSWRGPVADHRTECSGITAFMTAPRPAGTIVRQQPAEHSRALGIIPAPMINVPDFGTLPASIEVIGSENGWLRIRNAVFDVELAGRPVPDSYTGEGWIQGSDVDLHLQTQRAFLEPSYDSAVVIDGRPDVHLDQWPVLRVVGCSGSWALVEWHRIPDPLPGQRPARWTNAAVVSVDHGMLSGWVTGICGAIETSCDGVNGTGPERAFRED
jgi:hypothetical protein